MDNKATENVQVTETEYESLGNSSSPMLQEATLISECMEHIKDIKRER